MSRYFQISVEAAPAGVSEYYDIEGAHRWRLPNRIGCAECGVYGALEPAYPTVDPSGWTEAAALDQPTGLSWPRFSDLVASISLRTRRDVVLCPGTEFGSFVGRVSGAESDFVLGPIHFLFATPTACVKLTNAGVAVPARVTADLRAQGRTTVALDELEVPSIGRMADASYEGGNPACCGTCGRQRQSLVRVVLESGGLQASADLIRPRNHATIILASHRFVDAFRQAELTGLEFQEVEILPMDT